MLQGVKAKVSLAGRIRMAVNRHHAAFFAKLVVCDDSGQ
jgi:hypothetical protein